MQGEALKTAEAAAPTTTISKRLASLDGLRGVAAAVVLIHHGLLTVPSLSVVYFQGLAPQPEAGTLPWLLSYTPLHALWAGREAVYLFFVLSGLVLVLPVLRGTVTDWFAYYPQRLVRLYGPVFAAVAFALLLITISPRSNDPALGMWPTFLADGYSLPAVVQDLILINGVSNAFSPLWSLRWEVVFSMALPLLVLLAVAARRHPVITSVLLAGVVVLGAMAPNEALFLLSMFAVGALLAAHWDRLGPALESPRLRFVWPVAVVAALVAVTTRWTLAGLGVSFERANSVEWLPVAGVIVLVLAAGFWKPLRRLLETRLLQWLGVVSFSLYLVHEPIVLAVRFATFSLGWSAAATLLISIPLSILTAHVFSRLIEMPLHRLSKRVGARAAAVRRARWELS